MSTPQAFAAFIRQKMTEKGIPNLVDLEKASGGRLKHGWLRKAVSQNGVRRPTQDQLAALEELFGPFDINKLPEPGVNVDEESRFQAVAQKFNGLRSLVSDLYQHFHRSNFDRRWELQQVIGLDWGEKERMDLLSELVAQHSDDRKVLIEYFRAQTPEPAIEDDDPVAKARALLAGVQPEERLQSSHSPPTPLERIKAALGNVPEALVLRRLEDLMVFNDMTEDQAVAELIRTLPRGAAISVPTKQDESPRRQNQQDEPIPVVDETTDETAEEAADKLWDTTDEE